MVGLSGRTERIGLDQLAPRREHEPQVWQSEMTVGEFVREVFVPEHVAQKTLPGRTHYQAMLKHVLTPEEVDRAFRVDPEKSKPRLQTVPGWPYLSEVRLCDARPDHVQRLISAAVAHRYSTQTVTHIRSVVSAIFEHAKKKQWLTGDNPARWAKLPGMARKEPHGLTLDQANEVLGALRYPEREMVLLAILTSMNMSEICGLQWRYVNLTETWSAADGEPIAPRTIAVRKKWYRGELSRLSVSSRKRDLPIPDTLLPVLVGLSRRASFTHPDDFVLVSRAGTPVKAEQVATRRLKAIGKAFDMPWLSWRVFHRTGRSLAHELGLQTLEGIAMRVCAGASAATAKIEDIPPRPATKLTLQAQADGNHGTIEPKHVAATAPAAHRSSWWVPRFWRRVGSR